MEGTVQVVLGAGLLRAADRAARRLKVNRSQLIRQALREHLNRIRTLEKERLDRQGYEKFPDDEFAVWDKVMAWPED